MLPWTKLSPEKQKPWPMDHSFKGSAIFDY